jgi:hypothetical protein
MTTKTTTAIWGFIPNGVPSIAEEPFTVPAALEPAYIEAATDVSLFTRLGEGRDHADNWEASIRGFGKRTNLHVEERPEPFAPGMTRTRELAPNEIADRILSEFGVSPRGVWAHGLAIEYAATVTSARRARELVNAQDLARLTCPVCGKADEFDPPRVRRDSVTGSTLGSHPRIASLTMCSDCHAVALAKLTESATTTKTANGKTRAVLVAELLA